MSETVTAVEKVKVGGAAFDGDEEEFFEYTVPNAQTKKPLGTLFLKNVKQPVIDRYRDIRNGNGRQKGDTAKAREYLFRKAYGKFEFAEPGVEFDLGKCKTELEFFLLNATKVVDASMIAYLGEVFPDVEGKKSPTQSD